MVATPTTSQSLLTDDMLRRFRERAPAYDRENRFFQEDFDELKAAGYLNAAVPRDFGGLGLSLAEVAQLQRRLAYYAPATALGVNMHFYWTGVARQLHEWGDTSLDWMLQESVAGEVFAAGHAETGNDLPLFLSTSRAERVDGGYKIYGRKGFGSLGPVWTRLGLHAMDATHEGGPHIVHAFLPRDTEGYRIEETWDTLGMRPTRSDDTILEGAFVPDRYIARVVPAGTPDEFVLSIFAWALVNFAHIYLSIGERARDLAVEMARSKTSLAVTRTMAYHPEVQHAVADMVLALDAAGAQIDRVAADWSAGVDYGHDWPSKLVSAKYNAVNAAQRVCDLALAISGGFGMFKKSELERLYRDVRCGGFHPANEFLTHEIVGKTALGIDLGEQPRWG